VDAHHVGCPTRFVNRVENGVIYAINGKEVRLRHLCEVGRKGTHRSGGCHIDLDRPPDDVYSIDEPEISDRKTEFRIDDLSQSSPGGRFALISRPIPVHVPKSIEIESLLAGCTLLAHVP